MVKIALEEVQQTATAPFSLDEWLDDLETQRAAIIMLLRSIDRRLVQHGRLRSETLPRRVR